MGKSNKNFGHDRGDRFDRKSEHKAYRQEMRTLLKAVENGEKIEEDTFDSIDEGYKSGRFSAFFNED